jgi:hypothetical protein
LTADMEFPAEEWPHFEAADFELAVPRGSGKAVMELMMQLRPNGRAMDHFRVALGGSCLFDAVIGFGTLLTTTDLQKLQLTYDFWAADVKIRRNMSTSEWYDIYDKVLKNKMKIQHTSGKTVDTEELTAILDLLDRSETFLKTASMRYAVVAGPDNKMWLELQGLPGSAKMLNSKPAFTG